MNKKYIYNCEDNIICEENTNNIRNEYNYEDIFIIDDIQIDCGLQIF